MIEFVLPIFFFSAGILFIIFPRQCGVTFCRLGKAIWRVSTLGLTDMHWFYREDKAPKTFRLLGIGWTLISLPFFVLAISSFSGPGMLSASREARGYLREQFGAASTWRVSSQPAPSGDSEYLVQYRYGDHSGILRASWKGDHFTFSEEPKGFNKAPDRTVPSTTPPAAEEPRH